MQAIESGIGAASRSELKQVVILQFGMRNLPKMDTMSNSDPFVVLYALKNQGRGKTMRQMVGKTEVIWDNHNPDFVKAFEVDYYFEETQRFLLEVYDMDDENAPNDLSKHDFMGSTEFVLGHVVSSPD
jgi:Ca2+-dependent lipid-binding protein